MDGPVIRAEAEDVRVCGYCILGVLVQYSAFRVGCMGVAELVGED